jgi:outer membrane protein, heavy metal efflux system
MGRIVLKIAFALLITQVSFSQTTYSLKKALETSKINNVKLKAQSLSVDLAEGNVISARLRPNPTLNNQSLQLADPLYFPANTVWSDGKNRQVWWQLTKQFQLPAQRKYKIDFAERHYQASQYEYTEVERNLLGEVANKWVDAWAAKKRVDLLQSMRGNMDSCANLNRSLYKSQTVTEMDLNQTELLTLEYDIRIKSAEQEYANELNNLKLLLGVHENIVVDTSSKFDAGITGNLDSLLQQAQSSRPDMLSLKVLAESAHSNIRWQKALSWPTPELGFIYNPQNTVPYMGLFGTIQIPVFSRNQGEIKRSQLLKLQAEHQIIYNQQLIQTEVTNAYNSYQTEKANLTKYRTVVNRSDAILNGARQLCEQKGANMLEYLLAQRSWLEIQQHYNETLKSYMLSYIRLLYVSGLISQFAK